MPGSFASSSMSAVMDADVVCMAPFSSPIVPATESSPARPAERARAEHCRGDGWALEAHAWRQLHAASHRLHHLRLRRCHFPKRILESGQDQIFEHADIFGVYRLRIKLDGGNFILAVDGDGHSVTTRDTLERAVLQVFLHLHQPGLHLLEVFHVETHDGLLSVLAGAAHASQKACASASTIQRAQAHRKVSDVWAQSLAYYTPEAPPDGYSRVMWAGETRSERCKQAGARQIFAIEGAVRGRGAEGG